MPEEARCPPEASNAVRNAPAPLFCTRRRFDDDARRGAEGRCLANRSMHDKVSDHACWPSCSIPGERNPRSSRRNGFWRTAAGNAPLRGCPLARPVLPPSARVPDSGAGVPALLLPAPRSRQPCVTSAVRPQRGRTRDSGEDRVHLVSRGGERAAEGAARARRRIRGGALGFTANNPVYPGARRHPSIAKRSLARGRDALGRLPCSGVRLAYAGALPRSHVHLGGDSVGSAGAIPCSEVGSGRLAMRDMSHMPCPAEHQVLQPRDGARRRESTERGCTIRMGPRQRRTPRSVRGGESIGRDCYLGPVE